MFIEPNALSVLVKSHNNPADDDHEDVPSTDDEDFGDDDDYSDGFGDGGSDFGDDDYYEMEASMDCPEYCGSGVVKDEDENKEDERVQKPDIAKLLRRQEQMLRRDIGFFSSFSDGCNVT